MLERAVLNRIFRNLRVGGLRVTYWDKTSEVYGPDKPELHITFRTKKVVRAMLRNITVGFGEGYMNGQIEIDGPLTLIGKLTAENTAALAGISRNRMTRHLNVNRVRTQAKNIEHHYDLGNEFYKLWLDKSLLYSCAYFKTPDMSLEDAQTAKVEHILRKLQLQPGMTLLDIGCGWGQLLIRAAQVYGVRGHGITLSREQFAHDTAEAKRMGLEQLLTFELKNYVELADEGAQYDRVVSVGMFEHVGRRNQVSYFQAVDKLLKPQGLSLLHTITNEFEAPVDPWIDKYIFPGGYIPSVRESMKRLPEHNFRLLDYENLRIHYAKTCEEWLRRYESHQDEVIRMYDERFYRMWRLYIAGSASAFRYGDLSLSQYVFSKGLNNGLPLTREHIYA